MVSDDQNHSWSDWENLSVDSLLDDCIQGRQDAWKEFLRRFGPLIRGVIIRKLSSIGLANAKSDADDIFQDVLKSLVDHDRRALASIRNRDKIESWLCATALHKTADFFRKKKRSRYSAEGYGYVSEEGVPYSPAGAEDAGLTEEVWEAVGRLQPDEQILLKWRYVHDLKYKEIANLANIPINTVSSRLFRIKKKLSRHLEKERL